MPARKMRIELFDSEDNKYTITLEGNVTREKALKILDLVELLGGMASEEASAKTFNSENKLSKYEKVRLLVKKNFPLVWFSSKEVQIAYEREFMEPINLSTVATYLARMMKRGLLIKMGNARPKYKLVLTFSQPRIKTHSR